MPITQFHFYNCLARLACWEDLSLQEQGTNREKIQTHQEKLKLWAAEAPMNFLHKWQLIEAERQRVLGNRVEALDLYDLAIAGAKENKYTQEEALGNELAAKFYLEWGKEKVAAGYMQEAYYCYARWGAKAKTDDLEKRYPDLLRSILHSAVPAINAFETLAKISAPHGSIQSSPSAGQSAAISVNKVLDFATILKASQSLSETIDLDELLQQLMQIILQNSGGDHCVLVLSDDDQTWQVAAIATLENIQLVKNPLDGNLQVPTKLIQYVKNIREPVIVNNSKTELPVIGQYFGRHQPKSAMGLPIISQAKLVGVLYLENRATSNVFTGDRRLMLNFLCTQAAIALENVRLYQTANQYTQQLQKSLDQLQQSNLRFQDVFQNSTDAISLFGDQGFIDCNQAMMDLLGYTEAEEFCKLHPAQISPEFQADGQSSFEAANAMLAIARSKGHHHFEWQHQRKNGEVFWTEMSLIMIPYNGKQVMYSVMRDIGDRKAAEAALSESEQRFRDVSEAAGEYIWEVDAQAIYTYVTGKSTQVKGYSPAQLLGRSPMELMHPEDIEPTSAIVAEAAVTKSSFMLQHRTILPTGAVVWEEISGLPLLNQAGEIIGFRGTGLNITDRNNAEQALRRSLEESQQTSQDLAEAVALSNGQQKILALIAQGISLEKILAETALYIESQTHHPAYCSFLRVDAENQLRNLAAPSLSDEYIALVDGLRIGPEVGSCGTAAYLKASVTVNNIETDPLWKDYYPLALKYGLKACASTPILGANGEVLATLAMYQPEPSKFTLHDRKLMEVATDLARIAIERHQADVELQQLNLKIIQGEKMASLGNLVAGVAHEINNPLGFLNGSIRNAQDYVQDLMEFIDLYQEQYPQANELIQEKAEDIDLVFLNEDLPKLLGSMQGATSRIRSISNSLRTFSRADTEFKVSTDLHEGIDSTLLILKYRLKANNNRPAIKVVKNYGELSMINCFPSQLNQVFMNLLANAIDMFDEAAQQLTYPELETLPQTIFVETSVLPQENAIMICIKDNGKGMSVEVRERIFDQLFTTKGVGKGTGLGLAIAQQIVREKHGGRLEVESELGQGSEFKIYLPINPT
ncbi:MAG: PAS domain S-box protein [Limnothrix sp. RL_2_0]|nr:PAS domain S-box protein [Limnothrix sp. RL_2_0]